MARKERGTDYRALVAPILCGGRFLGDGVFTLRIIYDVGGVSLGSLKRAETDGVSRSSKQMPPRAGQMKFIPRGARY